MIFGGTLVDLILILAMIFGTAFALTCIIAPLWMYILHERRNRKAAKSLSLQVRGKSEGLR